MFFISLLIAFTGCSQEDGDWDDMVWNISKQTQKDNYGSYIPIPAEGGSCVLTCKNYGFWVTAAVDNEENNHTDFNQAVPGDSIYFCDDNISKIQHLTTRFASIKWKDQTMAITFNKNTSGKTRSIIVHVSAGDAFSEFRFVQDKE